LSATILLVEPNEILRNGIGCALGSSGRAERVMEASDERSALEILERVRVDAVVIGSTLLEGEGGLIDRIATTHRAIRSVVIAGISSRRLEPPVTQKIPVGAETVRGVAELRMALDWPVAAEDRDLDRTQWPEIPLAGPSDPAPSSLPALTRREVAVLTRIGAGFTNREIAEALGISRRTVDSHRTRLMRKLGIKKTAGLVRFAVREGLIEP